MKISEQIALVLFVCLVIGYLLVWTSAMFGLMPPRSGKFYDCRISEISPDIPPSVKEECRRRNAAMAATK